MEYAAVQLYIGLDVTQIQVGASNRALCTCGRQPAIAREGWQVDNAGARQQGVGEGTRTGMGLEWRRMKSGNCQKRHPPLETAVIALYFKKIRFQPPCAKFECRSGNRQ
jgi:hypothetical protein